MDVQDISVGADFAEAIEKTVAGCDVLIAVIGPRWLETLKARQSGPDDFVRHEIASALRRGVTAIPALVGGAVMPSPAELPEDLRPLARRQAAAIRDNSFDQDSERLIRGIQSIDGQDKRFRRVHWLVLVLGILIAVAGSAVFLINSRRDASLDGTWIARMQRPGHPPWNIRLTFRVSGKTLTGQVVYPTGSAAIAGGTVDHGNLTFYTKHVPQFETDSVTIVFSGRVKGREVDLISTAPDGTVTKGLARKSD